MTTFADWIYDAIIAHDRVATFAIMAIVFGIALVWLRALSGFLGLREHRQLEHCRAEWKRNRWRREFRMPRTVQQQEEGVERARLTVALLPEKLKKGA